MLFPYCITLEGFSKNGKETNFSFDFQIFNEIFYWKVVMPKNYFDTHTDKRI